MVNRLAGTGWHALIRRRKVRIHRCRDSQDKSRAGDYWLCLGSSRPNVFSAVYGVLPEKTRAATLDDGSS